MNFINQGEKNSTRFLVERFYYASLRDRFLAYFL